MATRDAVWGAGQGGPKILLVDLDNLRGRPRVWRERMEAIVSLAEGADRVYLAGQGASVALACPHLGDYAKWAVRVPMGPDAADKYLLEQAGKVSRRKGARPHFVIASNDFLFARLGRQGRLSVVSPEASLVSKRLAASAAAVYAFAA